MSVLIKEDCDSEMMEIYVNGVLFDCGNFWDFYTRDTLENVLDSLGVKVSREDFEYDTYGC